MQYEIETIFDTALKDCTKDVPEESIFSKETFCSYMIKVWNGKSYVEWGIPYSTEKEAVDCFENYLDTIYKFTDSPYYAMQYINYTEKPFKVVITEKIIITNNPVEKEIQYVKKS